MSGALALDEFLESQPKRVHKSHRKLARVVREAYPIGVPALIMKSSTDRLGASAGYSFHLGTPDDILRRIASWLITCLLYTSPSPRDAHESRMPSSA